MSKKLVMTAVLTMASAMLVSTCALAYVREESTTASGGTVVTVYSGTVDTDEETYLEGDLDYVSFNQYRTAMNFVSVSNITALSNFTYAVPASSEETARIGNGGVAGVSWDGVNTLTLDHAAGTIITVSGPELHDLDQLNTYNDKLELMIDADMPNLTYHSQYDNFVITTEEGTEESPHTKENKTEQDVVYVELVGENSFANFAISGNVKVVFEGDGSLTLEAGSLEWNYNERSNPKADQYNAASVNALASYPTVGYQGQLTGEEGLEEHMEPEPGRLVDRVVTDTFEYAIPEIELADGLTVTEGGDIHNTSQVTAQSYPVFAGDTDVYDESRVTEQPEGVSPAGSIRVDGQQITVYANEDASAWYVEKAGQMPVDPSVWYDVTDGIEVYQPWMSYVGAEGEPAARVVISGQ